MIGKWGIRMMEDIGWGFRDACCCYRGLTGDQEGQVKGGLKIITS